MGSRGHRIGWRAALLVGASIGTLATALPARAQTASVLRGAAGLAAPTVPLPMPAAAAGAPVLTGAQASASARAIATQARAQAAINLAQQAQTAARASVPTGGIRNGLVTGGLVPVAMPVLTSNDPTGLNTWDGASAPRNVIVTQDTGGAYHRSDAPVDPTGAAAATIDIQQTASRAILSWDSFNVGRDTTVNFIQGTGAIDPQTGRPAAPQAGWIALNRVVGQIDPATGLRNPLLAPAPSQILGSIKADGTVLVLNANGVLFGAGSQVNTGSLIVSSLEIGRNRALEGQSFQPLTLAQRNAEFLNFGLLGYADQASTSEASNIFTFSPVAILSDGTAIDDPTTEGAVTIEAGARITSGEAGFVMALAPKVVNHGTLTAADGQISLQSGRRFRLQRSEGDANSLDPNIRGLIVGSTQRTGDAADYVYNDGLIQSPHGYLSLGATLTGGAVFNDGVLSSLTSVARNGFIDLTGATIDIGDASTMWIAADSGIETIPQSMESIDDFKTSRIVIGDAASNIRFGGGSLLVAPSADVQIGSAPGATNIIVGDGAAARVFVDGGATFDVSGVKDVEIAASRNQIAISPVKRNELRDTPTYRTSFLNGASVYVDPRLSGVRSDGVRWVGSPLIEAESYYAQVGISAAELMTKGGAISLGTSAWSGTEPTTAPDVIVKQGASFDISGGWVRYDPGVVMTSRLVTSSGGIVDIGAADPNGEYIGIVGGFTESQSRWGMSTTFANPLMTGEHYVAGYIEGRDAGALTLKGSAIAFDGTIHGDAFAGPQQLAGGTAGTASGSVYGDRRPLQGAPSQLPAGGYVAVQALALSAASSDITAGGGDIELATAADAAPLAGDLGFGTPASIDADGNLVTPVRGPDALLPEARRDTILLSGDALDAAGLGQLDLLTSGKVTVDRGVALNLAPGGVFVAAAGRAIQIAGSVTAPGGTIDLQTYEISDGNLFTLDPEAAGSFDVVVDGTLSTRGRWANDYLVTDPTALAGRGYLDGGSIRIAAAPRVSIADGLPKGTSTDISGSILINAGALLDVSSGGYVASDGAIDTSGRGGDLSLIEETTYFQLSGTPPVGLEVAGNVPGFRVTTNPASQDARNPDMINARVAIADGTIRAYGFQGGGTFSLTTPALRIGDGPVATGTALPLDFFSKTGFGAYDLTSYATALLPNTFRNHLGGYNAILATQTLEIGAGQTLALTQTRYQPLLSDAQTAGLRSLASGGDLATLVAPTIAPDAYDRLGIDLTFGGLTELHVADGGAIQGDAGSSLTVAKLWNEGTIRLVGGTLAQNEVLPSLYASAYAGRSLADFFTIKRNGSIAEGATNALGVVGADQTLLTNAQLAAQPLYLLGALDANEGIRLSTGSTVDLSGASIRDPRAPLSPDGGQLAQGTVVAGGTLSTAASFINVGAIFARPVFGEGVYRNTLINLAGARNGLALDAAPGAVIDLRGASDSYSQLDADGTYVLQPVWSDGGALVTGAAARLTGADIRAQGGSTLALGGTLDMLDPVLTAIDRADPIANLISAAAIGAAGFDTFVARGSLTGSGDVALSLRRGFFLGSRPFDGNDGAAGANVPTIAADGALSITAPYIRLEGVTQSMTAPPTGPLGTGSVTLDGALIDVAGAVRFDPSVAAVNLNSSGDLRLIGAQPYQVTLGLSTSEISNSLLGQLVVAGDLAITAAQVYPTTGSTFLVASSGEDATITIGRAKGAAPATPYSAGGNLLIQAANIVQAGTVRVPIGSLTIGSTSALMSGGTFTPGGQAGTQFAPATQSVTLAAGSVTSVSADGLSIPYGITTDQIEYYFTPTNASPLTAPPAAILHLGGTSVSLDAGATVDLKGGGDLYAYEFVPGTGGSRDVLDRFNTDPYSSNSGYQYPDKRQVYAIVPGLSSATAAAYDPIYSADYGDLYSTAGAGRSVYFDAAPGLAAGWYTLLPAKYALLPGGMRVVEQTGITSVLGASATLRDGSVIATGYFGDAGSGTRASTPTSFSVESQAVFRTYSNIVTTSADSNFAALAAKAGNVVPRLPIDAGRLILEPIEQLALATTLSAAPASGGRGTLVDIAGSAFEIGSALPATADPGVIALTADGLTGLGAQSLLIGGIRTENADGTTGLALTATDITIDNDAAHPLTAPELLLGVAGSQSRIRIADGAVVTASGTLTDANSADYRLDAGESALVRVADGPQRLIARSGDRAADPASIAIGAATLGGTSVLIDSSGRSAISEDATIAAASLALGAAEIRFSMPFSSRNILFITPQLAAEFATTDLALRASGGIMFETGGYHFGALQLDTPTLAPLRSNGAVTIATTGLTLANSSGATIDCAALGGCSAGSIALSAPTVRFGDGSVFTGGFGGGTSLAASTGITYAGVGGLDAGAGALTLATPYLVDAAATIVPGATTILPKLTLATTGAVAISGAGGATPASGTPGAGLAISGDTIAVSGTRLRATAGSLSLDAQGDIALTDGAVVETPGYAKLFGDATDGTVVSATGGTLRLTTLAGGITLDGTSRLSVGGGIGRAGLLALQAQNGQLLLDGTIDAIAPDGGGSLLVDAAGAFDLDRFAVIPNGFTGDLSISTATGDLALGAGHGLTASSVMLTADGGGITIGGTIDTSGIGGGDVSLFGRSGVTLAAGAKIDAHADGYGASDSRQARGGDVTLGTDDGGTLTLAANSTIDVGARETGDRLVSLVRNGQTFYSYVSADAGGIVRFRAPLIGDGGATGDSGTVNLIAAGDVTGARAVVVEAFRRWDLGSVAGNSGFSGVTIDADGQAVLDTGASADGTVNFLSGIGAGTLPDYIRNFALTDDVGNFAKLTTLPGYIAQPGVELDYSGDITLASNWNFGAGTVDVDAAIVAGDMRASDKLDGKNVVVQGREGDLLENFTDLLYRVGGKASGAPGAITLRAGGKLAIKGSVSDGTFTFGDQSDADYLAKVVGSNSSVYSPTFATSCTPFYCAAVPTFTTDQQFAEIDLNLGMIGSTLVSGGSGGKPTPLPNDVPYNADKNSAAAAGGGDPFGSAQVFPLLADGSYVASSDYRFVAGADLGDGHISVNPLSLAVATAADLAVLGQSSYSYGGSGSSFSGTLLVNVPNHRVDLVDFVAGLQLTYPTIDTQANTVLSFSGAPSAVLAFLQQRALAYFHQLPTSQYVFTGSAAAPSGVRAGASTQAAFLQSIAADLSALIADPATGPTPPGGGGGGGVTTVSVRNFVRTGTGAIQIAASGDIDLTNGAAAYASASGGKATAQSGYLTGGSAIYTLGHLVAPAAHTIADPATGLTLTVDPTAFVSGGITDDEFAGYKYGSGERGILVSDPVYLAGGGDVALTAGGSVLGRRDVQEEAQADSLDFSFIGASDQPWRVGIVGDATDLRVNTTLFRSGVATLGGGAIRIAAGGDVSDLTAVALTSATTADVTSDTVATRALLTYGGGDVAIRAGGDVVGGRFDLGSGSGTIVAGGDIMAGDPLVNTVEGSSTANGVRVRLADATLALAANGDIALQGIAALGAMQPVADVTGNLNSRGFYSAAAGIDLLANGAITIANRGADVIIGASNATPGVVAVYPGTLTAAALTGDITLTPDRDANSAVIELVPSAAGNLQLLAGGDLTPVTIQMDDRDSGQIPGLFSVFAAQPNEATIIAGQSFGYFGVLPSLTTAQRAALHNAALTHLGDPVPVRIAAGGDISQMILSTAKQTRISAGRDIVDMVFSGQNLSSTDVTRVVAGRDITATSALTRPQLADGSFGDPQPALQGNDVTIGGPGAFILEAGRDAGPFLNSAVSDPTRPSALYGSGPLSFGGGVLSVGNENNPFLPTTGADIAVLFGVAKGANFAGLRQVYLDPTTLDALPDDLFFQVGDANGNLSADRSAPIYTQVLADWLSANAGDVVGSGSAAATAIGALDGLEGSYRSALAGYLKANNVAAYNSLGGDAGIGSQPILAVAETYERLGAQDAAVAAARGSYFDALVPTLQQIYPAFASLSLLRQRPFLTGDVYFNELQQTSVPTSASYLKYSRGYQAVNTLFPAALGYTANSLDGGAAGASTTISTGNLDLRLATIQTSRGGSVTLLGPGGRILAGSTVSTADQAARRTYDGARLLAGDRAAAYLANGNPGLGFSQIAPASIQSIPTGYEGILTLRGGAIESFTDTDLLLNQSRLFTEGGGDIVLWSSNGDVNAGQGPKTSANFPPVVVRIDPNGFSTVDAVGGVSGAGIAAFQPAAGIASPDVFLIAPRGTVDAGDAGVRVAGDLFVAAAQVANADNFKVAGTTFGVVAAPVVDAGTAAAASAASAAAQQAAVAAAQNKPAGDALSRISVDVQGYAGSDDPCGKPGPKPASCGPTK